MKKKLLGTYIIIISITMIITIFFSWNKTKEYFFDRIEVESISKTNLLLEIFSIDNNYDENSMQNFVDKYSKKSGSRITIIQSDGLVVAESDGKINEMDNHRFREEIKNAFEKQKVFLSLRYSNTLKGYYQYVAAPINTDNFTGVLRTATPLKEVEIIINEMLMMILVGIVIGAIVAIIVAYQLTKRFMEPINELTEAAIKISEGDYEDKIYIDQSDEVGVLAEAFNNMIYKLRINRWTLENKNAELESILSSMGSGIIVVGHDLKVGIYNKKFLELFNIKDEVVTGKLFYEVTRNLVIFEMLEQALELGKMIVKEAKVYEPSGEKIYLIYANQIKSKVEPRKKFGALLVVQDITQMRKLENMRSDFVSNVTHELKTPLTSIRGFVETLKNGAIDDEKVALQFLNIIDIEAERLEGLIHDILVLSEIEAMVGENNIKDYNMEEIVNEVIEILMPEAIEKKIKIEPIIENDLKSFRCNKNRIKQLIINIVGNAIKYTDEGFVKIYLREEFNNLLIIIEDTGIGIEKKHIPRLFERFYRVDKGRSRSTGGTGLGLSIAKHIVELYNGKINIDSKESEGTKVKIRLPY